MEISDFSNSTYNQHFVSQAEQRLNSCSKNPALEKSEIHCFSVKSKMPAKVLSEGKFAIWRNLSFQDLFTIFRTPNKKRINLENIFQRYEGEFSTRAANLLEQINKVRRSSKKEFAKIDLKEISDSDFSILLNDVKFIYKYKIMTGIRNPYKIKDTLRDFRFILNHSINDTDALQLFFLLDKKNESEEKRICETYSISQKEYREWIRLLLLILYSKNGDATILDGFADEFFRAKEYSTSFLIHIFDNECALLPDTGVVKDSFSDDQLMYMNVSKGCIILLKHTKIDERFFKDIFEKLNLSSAGQKEFMDSLGGKVFGSLFINDAETLFGYNKICVQAAAKHVFSGASEISGVEIVTKEEA